MDENVPFVKRHGDPDYKRISIILERSGFVTWRLTEIRMPALTQQATA